MKSRFKDPKWLAIFFMTILLGGFIILTSEVNESLLGKEELIGRIDQETLSLIINNRNPKLNGIVIDLTALGSATVLTIITISFCTFFTLTSKTLLATQFLMTVAGSGVLTSLLKFYFERSRPDLILRLVEVQGFSYPSGHSLSSAATYFTLSIITCKFVNKIYGRVIVWIIFLSLITLIGMTRLYLGVHFFSDVLAGILIGIAWASLIEYVMSILIKPYQEIRN